MYENRLKELREQNQLTQTFIAERLGIKQQQYSRYEKNQNDLPTGILIDIALLYNTSVDYVLGITNIFQPYPRIPKKGENK